MWDGDRSTAVKTDGMWTGFNIWGQKGHRPLPLRNIVRDVPKHLAHNFVFIRLTSDSQMCVLDQWAIWEVL